MSLVIFLLFIAAPIGTLIHESGHAIGMKLMKAENIQMTIGFGWKLFRVVFGKDQLTVNILFFIGGFVKSYRKEPYNDLESICITLLGPLHNMLYAIIFFGLDYVYGSEYLKVLFLFNSWLAVVNILPFKIQDKLSDGLIVYRILKSNRIKP